MDLMKFFITSSCRILFPESNTPDLPTRPQAMAPELLMRFVDGLRSLSSLPTVFLKCCPRTGHHILPEVSLLLVRVQYIFFTYTFQNNGYFLYYDIIFFFFLDSVWDHYKP